MSEKKAKEARRLPQIVIRIEVFGNGRVEVVGFPLNFTAAMEIMQAGVKRMTGYFIAKAREGKVDDKLNLEKDLIVRPGMPEGGMPIPIVGGKN